MSAPIDEKETAPPAAGESERYFDASAGEGKEATATSGGQLAQTRQQPLLKDTPSDEEDAGLKCPSHTTDLKLMSKIDAHVVPFLCVMYLLAFLDRVNISNARLFKLEKDLDMDPNSLQFSTALVIFFVPYCLCEIPSNMLLKKFKPSTWLAVNMFFFGFTTIMQGVVTSYGGLLTARFFLGLFETGMFPGAFYMLGMWYRRTEAQKRFSFFFNSTTLAGAFGGLLAAAIGKMDGMRGYSGWRWIFIIEGGITVFFSFFFYFLLPNFPEQVKWLKEDERAYITAKLRRDQGQAGLERPITFQDVLNVMKDYKVIVGGFMYFGLIVPAYSYAYFAPTILNTYHYSPIQTQLRSVPPWAAAFAFSMIIAYTSDKVRHRFLFALFAIAVAIAAFGILFEIHTDTDVQYAALFLAAMGAYTAMPVIVCWFNMNLGGHHRRAIGSAWQVGFGNLGGIVATFIFKNKKSEGAYQKFTVGYSVCMGFCCLSFVSCIIYFVACWKENKDRRDGKVVRENLTDEERLELGDRNPEYRYLL